jgi:hypothetical protein
MDIMTDRDKLIDRLRAASKQTRLQSYVLETISVGLRDRQISPAGALDWLKEEGLLGQFAQDAQK